MRHTECCVRHGAQTVARVFPGGFGFFGVAGALAGAGAGLWRLKRWARHVVISGALGTPDRPTLFARIALNASVGLVIASAMAFFEEIGWRAWLLPRLQDRTGARGAVIAAAVIWGLWHVPVQLSGIQQIDGVSPTRLALGFPLGIMIAGLILGWLRLRTENIYLSGHVAYLASRRPHLVAHPRVTRTLRSASAPPCAAVMISGPGPHRQVSRLSLSGSYVGGSPRAAHGGAENGATRSYHAGASRGHHAD